jgi:hypothetical protein
MSRVLKAAIAAIAIGAAKGTGVESLAPIGVESATTAKAKAKAKAKAPKAAKAAKAVPVVPVVPVVVPATVVPSSEGSASVVEKPKAKKGIKGFPIYPYFDSAIADAGRALTEVEFLAYVLPTLKAKDASYDAAKRVKLYFRDAENRVLGDPSTTPRRPRGRTGGTVYGPTRSTGEVTLAYDPKATVVTAPKLYDASAFGPEGDDIGDGYVPGVGLPKAVVKAAKAAKAAKAPKAVDFAAEAAKAERALRRDGAERDARKAAKAKAE